MKKIILLLLFLLLVPQPSHSIISDDNLQAEDPTLDEQFVDQEVQKQIANLEMQKTGVYWQKPDFSGQDGSVGWAPGVFDPPPGFKDRVNFWIDIYT
ncbi:MAG: hypothetical protein ACHQVK_03815, partial [Candidatus Paceibacterales bacterium]